MKSQSNKIFGDFEYDNFLEIINPNILHEIDFCSKAICKDIYRYFICCLHIEDKKIIATDGVRLHISDLSGIEITKEVGNEKHKIDIEEILPDGDYRILKITSKYAWLAKIKKSSMPRSFPNWKNVIPNEKKAEKIIPYQISTKDESRIGQAFSVFVNRCPGPVPINYLYIRDLGIGDYEYYYFDDKKLGMFKSKFGQRKAIIMHFIFDEEIEQGDYK